MLTLFGGAELDLTQAVFTDNACEINVFCLFGGIEVTVPEGTKVRNECIAIFGGSDTKTEPPLPGAPTVIVKGFIGFGGVEVRGPKEATQAAARAITASGAERSRRASGACSYVWAPWTNCSRRRRAVAEAHPPPTPRCCASGC